MVLFSGLWKANHRYDQDDNNNDYDNRRRPSPLNHLPVKQTHFASPPPVPQQQQQQQEDEVDPHNHEDEIGPREDSKLSESSSSTRKSRTSRRNHDSNNSVRPSYVKSVLFGGLWTRCSGGGGSSRCEKSSSSKTCPLKNNRHSDDYGSSKIENAFDGIEQDSSNHHVDDSHDGENDNRNNNGDDDDEGSNFPSLTNGFNPDEIDWSIMRVCTVYLSFYALMSIVAYCFVFEHWTVVDALYFAVSTFTTVGYGDLQPTTTAGQLFTIVFAIYGVIVLGIFIGIFGHAISEGQAHTVRKLKAGRQRKLVKLLFQSSKKIDAAREIRQNSFFHEHQSLMDDIGHVVKAELPAILLVILLAFILGLREGWSVTSIGYFAIMSASTTGYGDYTPSTQMDKVYCIFFLPISVAVFGEVLGRIASVYITRRTRQAEQNFLRRSMTKFDLHQMDTDDDGQVSMEEWLSFMLISLQKVDPDFLNDLKSIFYNLDVNGNGFVDKDDLVDVHRTPQWRQIQAAVKED